MRIGGGLHGFTFIAYIAVTVLVAVDQQWKLKDLLLGIGSAVIPYLTVPFERSALAAACWAIAGGCVRSSRAPHPSRWWAWPCAIRSRLR